MSQKQRMQLAEILPGRLGLKKRHVSGNIEMTDIRENMRGPRRRLDGVEELVRSILGLEVDGKQGRRAACRRI